MHVGRGVSAGVASGRACVHGYLRDVNHVYFETRRIEKEEKLGLCETAGTKILCLHCHRVSFERHHERKKRGFPWRLLQKLYLLLRIFTCMRGGSGAALHP